MKILSTTSFDVVLVPFPFSDLSSTKKRPCLVISSFKPQGLNHHSIIAMITSNLNGLSFPFDYQIKEFKKAGLPKPSILRLSKLVSIDNQMITTHLGKLEEIDQKKVSKLFRKLFENFI